MRCRPKSAMQQALRCLKQGVPVPDLIEFQKLQQIVGFDAYDIELDRYGDDLARMKNFIDNADN